MLVVGLAISIAVTTASVLFLTAQVGRSEQREPIVQGVPSGRLAELGVFLEATTTVETDVVDAGLAREAAGFSHLPVRETLLAVLTTELNPVPRLVWVVNFNPDNVDLPGGPPGSDKGSPAFMLAFVDATTGEFVMGVAEGGSDQRTD